MNYETKRRLLSLIGKHYIMLANDLKERLISTCDDVNDIMSDYAVMLNECNELEEQVKQEPDHATDAAGTVSGVYTDTDTIKVESTGINIKFTLAELQQTRYVVQDAVKNIDGDDYFAQKYRRILQSAETKLRDAMNVVFGTAKEAHNDSDDETT